MKCILSYLLLCIYAMIMIKPVMPTISDIFAHLLNYSEHIVTVHHDHGKSHVHSEYIEAAKKNSPENSPYNNILKKADYANEHLMFTCMIDLSTHVVLQEHLNSFTRHLPDIFALKNFRPPILPVI